MVSTRLVPRASGLLGHVAAEAGTDTAATVQTNNATRKLIECPALIYPAPINVILSCRLAPLAHSPTRSTFCLQPCYRMSAFGGKADMAVALRNSAFDPSGHRRLLVS